MLIEESSADQAVWRRLANACVSGLQRLPPTPTALAAVWLVAGAVVLDSRLAERDRTLDQATLFARILADHTSRALSGVDLAMTAASGRLSDLLEGRIGTHEMLSGPLQKVLSEVAAGQPLVRSLSLVDDEGRVQVSSQTGNVGARLAKEMFRQDDGLPRAPLVLVAGRDLQAVGQAAPGRLQHHMLLVSQPLSGASGLPTTLWVVAALNPDFFSNQYEVLLDSPGWQAAMSTLDGRFLAGTANLNLAPGQGVPVRLPDGDRPIEAGAVNGPGLGTGHALGAFRLARQHPVAVQAQLPDYLAYAPWNASLMRTLAAASAVTLLVLGLSHLVARQRRARELADDERQAVQHQLREQYELTEQLIEAMPVPVMLTDLAGDLQLTNRAMTQWMRLDAQIPEGPAARARDQRLQDVLQRGIDEVVFAGSHTWPLDLPGGDGTLRETVLTKVALRGREGQVQGVIGMLADVTEFRQAARAIDRARRAAEASNAARAEFMANVTHELRTPLQSILGFAELGIDRADGNARMVLMCQRIHGAGTRMLRLVEDLLDLSRIGSTVGHIHLQPLAVAIPIQEVVDELRPLAQSQNRILELDVAPSVQEAVAQIDALRLQQVVRNVIANALRFSPSGGRIDVSLRREGPLAVVRVRDHGPGIPQDETQSIFEPFVQSSRTKDGSGGTGLGLAICRQIMQAHHGQISASNHPEGGAEFRFSLPLMKAGSASVTTGDTAATAL